MKKIIYIAVKYPLFATLYEEAKEYDDIDIYIAERGWQEWMDNLNPEDIVNILNLIYDLSNKNIEALRTILNISRPEFSRKYKIPLRTIEDWDYKKREINSYILSLIAYTIFIKELNNDNIN